MCVSVYVIPCCKGAPHAAAWLPACLWWQQFAISTLIEYIKLSRTAIWQPVSVTRWRHTEQHTQTRQKQQQHESTWHMYIHREREGDRAIGTHFLCSVVVYYVFLFLLFFLPVDCPLALPDIWQPKQAFSACLSLDNNNNREEKKTKKNILKIHLEHAKQVSAFVERDLRQADRRQVA